MPAKTSAARRALLTTLTAGLGAVAGALAAVALVKNARDPAVAKARAAEQTRADQARRLARDGAPPEGGPAVHRNDPLLRGRELWDERCAECHGLDGAGGDKAPDLHGYNSRAWIRGFLQDPGGRLYMGPAKLDKGMRAVEATPEELEALVEVVYAETGARDVDAARAARGRDLLGQKDCDTCHDFDGSGENEGPNLKGRGTLPWLVAVISDAGHGLLYGPRNQMSRFASKLTPMEIDALARFVIAQRN
jgi:mono/diheme cytochrome c family protein